jgi:hypothetical protein
VKDLSVYGARHVKGMIGRNLPITLVHIRNLTRGTEGAEKMNTKNRRLEQRCAK